MGFFAPFIGIAAIVLVIASFFTSWILAAIGVGLFFLNYVMAPSPKLSREHELKRDVCIIVLKGVMNEARRAAELENPGFDPDRNIQFKSIKDDAENMIGDLYKNNHDQLVDYIIDQLRSQVPSFKFRSAENQARSEKNFDDVANVF
ncbi:MAG: hypothetical protein RL095_1761 [Verrucomicrobiota bacterium]|jgi:hypothetical protein